MTTDAELLKDIAKERKEIRAERARLAARLSWIDSRLPQLDGVEAYLRERKSLPHVHLGNANDTPVSGHATLRGEKLKIFTILNESNKRLTPKVIADRGSIVPSTVRNTLRKAVSKGEVHGEAGEYELTITGRKLFGPTKTTERTAA